MSNFKKALLYYQNNNLRAATQELISLLNSNPRHFDANFLLATIYIHHNDFSIAIKYFLKAYNLKKNDSELLINIGSCYHKLKNFHEALNFFNKAILIDQFNIDLLINKGITLFSLKKYHESIEVFNLALALAPTNFLTHHHKAQAEAALKLYDKSIDSYLASIQFNPYFSESYFFLGLLYSNIRQYSDSINLFNQAISLNSDELDYFSNKALSLLQLRKFDSALELIKNNLLKNPLHHHSLAVFGFYFLLINSFDKSEELYSKALSLDPKNPNYLSARSTVYKDLNKFDLCMADLVEIFSIDPKFELLLGNILQNCFDTLNFKERSTYLNYYNLSITNDDFLIFPPLTHFYFSDSPELQLKCATAFTNSQFYPQPCSFPKYAHSKIRIGYYSADFREHPVSYLIAELLELHNRSDFEIYAFSLYSPNLDDPLRKRIELGVDHFFDVASKSDQEIVDLSRKLEIDIAIDLGGHTKHARTQIFASRLAPVQVNYLGFPGAMGASFMDYIIADRYVIPEENQQFYSEKVVYLPGCFQPHDSKRRKSSKIFTRKELGLPENAFVYCCFNQAYKITPEIFQCWIEILQAVEGSVLWLPDYPSIVKTQIQLLSLDANVSFERIIFMQRVADPNDFLACICKADLFLDTFPYGAHATAADVLLSGLPLLSMSGSSYVSRVASSLLHVLNVPELITDNLSNYRNIAIKLGLDTEIYSNIYLKLQANLSLFQDYVPNFVTNFEIVLRSIKNPSNTNWRG